MAKKKSSNQFPGISASTNPSALKSAEDLAAYRRNKRQERRTQLRDYNCKACAEELNPLQTGADLFF